MALSPYVGWIFSILAICAWWLARSHMLIRLLQVPASHRGRRIGRPQANGRCCNNRISMSRLVGCHRKQNSFERTRQSADEKQGEDTRYKHQQRSKPTLSLALALLGPEL